MNQKIELLFERKLNDFQHDLLLSLKELCDDCSIASSQSNRFGNFKRKVALEDKQFDRSINNDQLNPPSKRSQLIASPEPSNVSSKFTSLSLSSSPSSSSPVLSNEHISPLTASASPSPSLTFASASNNTTSASTSTLSNSIVFPSPCSPLQSPLSTSIKNISHLKPISIQINQNLNKLSAQLANHQLQLTLQLVPNVDSNESTSSLLSSSSSSSETSSTLTASLSSDCASTFDSSAVRTTCSQPIELPSLSSNKPRSLIKYFSTFSTCSSSCSSSSTTKPINSSPSSTTSASLTCFSSSSSSSSRPVSSFCVPSLSTPNVLSSAFTSSSSLTTASITTSKSTQNETCLTTITSSSANNSKLVFTDKNSRQVSSSSSATLSSSTSTTRSLTSTCSVENESINTCSQSNAFKPNSISKNVGTISQHDFNNDSCCSSTQSADSVGPRSRCDSLGSHRSSVSPPTIHAHKSIKQVLQTYQEQASNNLHGPDYYSHSFLNAPMFLNNKDASTSYTPYPMAIKRFMHLNTPNESLVSFANLSAKSGCVDDIDQIKQINKLNANQSMLNKSIKIEKDDVDDYDKKANENKNHDEVDDEDDDENDENDENEDDDEDDESEIKFRPKLTNKNEHESKLDHSELKSSSLPFTKLSDLKNVKLEDQGEEFKIIPPEPLTFLSDSVLNETLLEGEPIACFVVGGEKRLCLPQIFTTVLSNFSFPQILQISSELQIHHGCCSKEQLQALKAANILPPEAPSCGLITKSDAERLCAALLQLLYEFPVALNLYLTREQVTEDKPLQQARASICIQKLTQQLPSDLKLSILNNMPFSDTQLTMLTKCSIALRVRHRCFGKTDGLLFPALYVRPSARCIICTQCQVMLSARAFVCHSHQANARRTCHWGFDASNWRFYLKLQSLHRSEPSLRLLFDEFKLHRF